MALPSIPSFDFPSLPNLPDLPGLPDIPDYNQFLESGLDSLISLGGAALINALFGNQWGIFTEFGLPILMSDNVLAFEEKHSSRISNLPVEKGSFTSYNKVSDPSTVTMTFSKGSGGATGRGAFLALLNTLADTTTKYYVITPEKVYRNYCITGHSQTRTADDGARLMKVAVTLEEVREVKVNYVKEEEPKNKENGRVVEIGYIDPEALDPDAVFVVADMEKEFLELDALMKAG